MCPKFQYYQPFPIFINFPQYYLINLEKKAGPPGRHPVENMIMIIIMVVAVTVTVTVLAATSVGPASSSTKMYRPTPELSPSRCPSRGRRVRLAIFLNSSSTCHSEVKWIMNLPRTSPFESEAFKLPVILDSDSVRVSESGATWVPLAVWQAHGDSNCGWLNHRGKAPDSDQQVIMALAAAAAGSSHLTPSGVKEQTPLALRSVV